MHKYILIYVAVALLALAGCKPKDGDDQFDRAAMLTNLSSNVIIPAHEQFKQSAETLKQKKDAFTGSPSFVTLDSLKTAFANAYLAYMKVEAYSFTPSDGVRNLNVFPTDTVQLNNNVASGSYDLNTANNIRAKGFAAIDYLLYSRSSNEVVNLFTVGANAATRKQYLNDITNEIAAVASASATAWSNFTSDFKNASGTDAGSSTGMLVNDLSFQTERCRRERVGNGLGYVGIIATGVMDPNQLEAKYSRISKELLIANLQSLKELYTGGTGTGFDDYLEAIDATDAVNSEPLAPAITAQFDLVLSKAQAVNGDFATALSNNKQQMEDLFLELKKLVVLIKVDASSQMGVVINYTDNDGD